jgi:hypothetical protein
MLCVKLQSMSETTGDPREETPHRVQRRRFRGPIEAAVWPGVVIFLAYAGYGLGMLFQSARFSRTPAYGNLTQVLDIHIWAVIHLIVAALFAAYVSLIASRLFGIIVHIYGLIVVGTWWLAFVIRWLTDESTTIVNVVSWGVLLLIMGRSASLIPTASRPGMRRVTD